MSERWAVQIVDALRGQAGGAEQSGLMFAKVKATQPITLKANDQDITKNLHINASLSLKAGDEVLVLQSGIAFYILLKVVPV